MTLRNPPHSSPSTWPATWIVTDGKAGMVNQCLGLAERIGLAPEVKRITLRPPFRQLVPYLRIGLSHAFAAGSDPIAPPWPDIAIGCGRAAIAGLLAIKRGSRGRSFIIYTQDPRISPRHFDLLVVPEHDRLSGQNVITTKGALHRVTPERLAAEKPRWAPQFVALPAPRIAVSIGGSSAAYPFGPAEAGELGMRLAALARGRTGTGGETAPPVSLMVTCSRRTSPECRAILEAHLVGLPNCYFWDGSGDNPYFGMLAHADAIIVTCDSANMVSEAASTGKPVLVAELEGGNAKFRRFLDSLYESGTVRPFTGALEIWQAPPLDETGKAALAVRERLAARGLWPPES
jgi:mitochondrial fission protein ELM1